MYTTSFEEIPLRDLLARAQALRHDGVRFVQLCAEMGPDDALNLLYTFYDEAADAAMNLVAPLADGDEVPSIQGLYFAAFSYENETHDLFGVRFSNMELDFGGHFFNLAAEAPMTIISPEQKAAREKAAKMKAAALKKAEAAAAKKALEQSAAEADAEAVGKIGAGNLSHIPSGGSGADRATPPVIPSGGGGADRSAPPVIPNGGSGADRAIPPVIPSGGGGADRAIPPVIPSVDRGAVGVEGSHQPEGDPSTSPLRGSAQDDKAVPAPAHSAQDDEAVPAPGGSAQDDEGVLAPGGSAQDGGRDDVIPSEAPPVIPSEAEGSHPLPDGTRKEAE